MTRQPRGTIRWVSTAAIAAAVLPVCLVSPAVAQATPTASTASVTASAVSGQYVAIATSGKTQRLQLVDRASGKVVRTLTAGSTDKFGGFVDADLAADGSVYAVISSGKSRAYDTKLVRYAKGRVTTVLQYVTSVEASPNGSRLAVTVLSPDGDRDGKGLEALRIVTPAGKLVRTLNATAFPVNRAGLPTTEVGGLKVQGWSDNSTVVVGTGCCAAANVHLVRTDKSSKASTWPSIYSVDDAWAIGTKGGAVLVARPYNDKAYNKLGIEALWLSTKAPKGTVVTRVKGANKYVATSADALVKKYGATPLYVSPKRFPYRGPGTVIDAHV